MIILKMTHIHLLCFIVNLATHILVRLLSWSEVISGLCQCTSASRVSQVPKIYETPILLFKVFYDLFSRFSWPDPLLNDT